MTNLTLPPLKDKSIISFKNGDKLFKTLPFVDMAGAKNIFYQLGFGLGVYACVYGKRQCQLLMMNNEYVILENGRVPIVDKTYDIGNGYTLRITLGGGRAWVINVNKPLVFWTDYPRVSVRTTQFGNGEFRDGFIALDDAGNYIFRNVTNSDGTIIGGLVKRTPILANFYNNIPQTPLVDNPADPARDEFNWGDMICRGGNGTDRHSLNATLFSSPYENVPYVEGKTAYQYAVEFQTNGILNAGSYRANKSFQGSYSTNDKDGYNGVGRIAMSDNRFRIKYIMITIRRNNRLREVKIFYCQGTVGN